MENGAKYEVNTYWGWFRLDEGASRDYLAGRLWICRTPGGRRTPAPAGESEGRLWQETTKRTAREDRKPDGSRKTAGIVIMRIGFPATWCFRKSGLCMNSRPFRGRARGCDGVQGSRIK